MIRRMLKSTENQPGWHIPSAKASPGLKLHLAINPMASFTPPPSTPLRDIGQKATWPLVFVILLAATAVFVIVPGLAIDWAQRVPFPSVLLQPNLLVSDASGYDWGPTAQLDTLDRVVGINDTPVG